jgi:hypothetical protein
MIRKNNTGLSEKELREMFDVLDKNQGTYGVQVIQENFSIPANKAEKVVGLWMSHRIDTAQVSEEVD